MEISYDASKNERNIALRGLPFDLVAGLNWADALIMEDTRKQYGERRFLALGYIGERLYAVVFTPRGAACRIISLRKANQREIEKYGQASQAG